MYQAYVIALFVLVPLAVMTMDADGNCATGQASGCAKPFVEKYGNADLASSLIVSRDAEEMASLCSDFFVMEQCFYGFINDCGEAEKELLSGLLESLQCLCGPALQVHMYLRQSDCITQAPVKDKVIVCNRTATISLHRIMKKLSSLEQTSWSIHQSEVDTIKRDFCSSVNTLLACMKKAVQEHCEEEVAYFSYRRSSKMSIRVSNYSKNKGSGGSSNGEVVGGVGVAVAAIVVTLVCCCVRLWLKERRETRRREQIRQIRGLMILRKHTHHSVTV